MKITKRNIIASLSAILFIIIMATIWVKLVPLVLTDLVNYLTNAPEPETNYWQTIDVYNVGSFRVPAEWYVEWDDRVLLVTDRPRDEEDYEVLLVGRISLGEEHVPGVPIRFYGLPNVDEFEWGETLWNSGLRSMGTDISLIEYFVDGERIERYFIGVSRSVRDDRGNIFTTFFSLLIWSNNVDSHTADQIARTFRVGL